MIGWIARWIVPSGILRIVRRTLSRVRPVEFSAVGASWPGAPTTGAAAWDEMADRLIERWPAFLSACEGTRPLDVAHEAAGTSGRNDAFHNTYVTFGYVLAASASRRNHSRPLSVLDWGGGLGHYFVLARALLPELALEYHVKDLSAVCERGRTLLPEVTFHDSDAVCTARTFDLVVASGALHCVPEWRATLSLLAQATEGWLLITRLPVLYATPSTVVAQDASQHGFASPLFEWFVNRDEFLGAARALGLVLVREFLVDETLDTGDAFERPRVRGFLFERGGPR